MPRIKFTDMPDEARMWVFGIGREVSAEEESRILSRIDGFLDDWAAHGAPLRCARDFRHGRFLLVSVDESSVPVSGCSVDALTHLMRETEDHLGTPIVDNMPVWFLDETGVQRVGRGVFKSLAAEGKVLPTTTVFDNTIGTVGQVRRGEWERPASESWHGRAYFRDALPA